MKKKLQIVEMLEKYGFQQVEKKDCFIAYYGDFCFSIAYSKACHGERWHFDCNANMLNAKEYQIGECPDAASALDYITLTSNQWEAKRKKNPDEHFDVIWHVMEHYTFPFFSSIALYKKADDFAWAKDIVKSEQELQYDMNFSFKPIASIQTYSMNDLLNSSLFGKLFDYLDEYGCQCINQELVGDNCEFHFKNSEKELYIIVIVTKGLFLSFEVFPGDLYPNREMMAGYIKNFTVTYYLETLFKFGWLIGDREKAEENISLAMEALQQHLAKLEEK